MKLHLGSGRTRKDGYINVDCTEVPGVTDLVCDLDGSDLTKHFEPDSVSESLGLHFLEHLHRPLAFMEALWTVTKPGGRVLFEVPYGSSDDAWEDPTHTRPYTLGSWAYFGQPNYWRADYGYRGDWRTREIAIFVDAAMWEGVSDDDVLGAVQSMRNVVLIMRAELEAVKPRREPLAELREAPALRLIRHRSPDVHPS